MKGGALVHIRTGRLFLVSGGGKGENQTFPRLSRENLWMALRKVFMRKIFPAVFTAVLAFALSGCVFIVNEVVSRIVELRTVQEQAIDAQIDIRLLNELEKMNESILFDVNIDVWRKRILLTGVVNSLRLRDTVTRLARQDERISAIHNEIQVDSNPPAEKNESRDFESGKISLSQQIGDIWIETKLQARLAAARGVRTANYHWRSIRNWVYIIGLARNAEERDSILRVIRETEGVQGYKEFIKIRQVK